MSGRLQSMLLARLDSTVLQVCRVRSSVLRLTLSALPYLLRLILRSSSSGRPWSVVPSRPRPCRSGKSCEQRFGVSPVEKGGWSRTVSPPWPGLSVRDQIVLPAYHYVSGPAREARVIATPSAGPSFYREAVHWGLQVYEPDTNIIKNPRFNK